MIKDNRFLPFNGKLFQDVLENLRVKIKYDVLISDDLNDNILKSKEKYTIKELLVDVDRKVPSPILLNVKGSDFPAGGFNIQDKAQVFEKDALMVMIPINFDVKYLKYRTSPSGSYCGEIGYKNNNIIIYVVDFYEIDDKLKSSYKDKELLLLKEIDSLNSHIKKFNNSINQIVEVEYNKKLDFENRISNLNL